MAAAVALVVMLITLCSVYAAPHVVANVGTVSPAKYLTTDGEAELHRSRWGTRWKHSLFMTYYDKSRIPRHVWDLFSQKAAGFDVVVHDDADVEQWLSKWYVPNVVRKFRALSGAHRADLIRFCWLYVKGGIYLDIKTVPLADLDQVFDERLVAVRSNVTRGHIGILSGPPGALLHGRMIDIIVRTPSSVPRLYYHAFVDAFVLNALPEAKAAGEDVLEWNEECDCAKYPDVPKDRYGLCCVIVHPELGVVMNGRDAEYPY